MKKTYTIGELAKAGKVAASTVRYYERVGLLKPSGRTEGNYRVYTREAVDLLRFIRAAQSAGFTLEDITSLIQFQDGETVPCAKVQHLIEHRLDDLRKRLKELREVESQLKTSLGVCKEAGKHAGCDVLEELVSSSKA